jgi:subtilisin family serine protease
MRILRSIGLRCLAAAALPAGAIAQIGLPALPSVDVGQALGTVGGLARLDHVPAAEAARQLADARIVRLLEFSRRNRPEVELDADRNPAVRGILIATGIDPAAIARAEGNGFKVIDRQEIEGLELSFVRFSVPRGLALKAARKALARLAPEAEVGVDHIYFASGAASAQSAIGAPAASGSAARPAIGMIDGGVAASLDLSGDIEQRGFAEGAPRASAHGTAIASLISGRSPVRGAATGAGLLAADVYGSAPTGGSATAIARALGWMATRRVPVVTISLVGPDNPLLRAAVREAQRKGILVVAAVGNDGPAAPPSFPASLPGVLAVTGTDARERVLPEAGRALHVDFAAPGSDMNGAAPGGGVKPLRGTSFAAPLVAARLSAHYSEARISAIEPAVRALMAEAKDLGRKGADPVYGHGLVCGGCAAR